uniref:Derlin n=1 Tax=Arcella intermedia TaxID=1963864 RepID=A0A6B2LHT1_9EUKA
MYHSVPLITKSYMTACLITTLVVQFELIAPWMLYLNWGSIYKDFQVWRLATNFFFFGYFGLSYVFHMLFLVRHSMLLEDSSYRGKTGDFFFLYLFGASWLLGLDWLFWYTSLVKSPPIFLGPSLAMMVVYVWSRRNPNVRMSFLQLFTFTAPYLPWVIFGIEFLIGQSWSFFDLIGILVGHLYYYLQDVYPEISGRRLLHTPQILKTFLDAHDATPAEH